MKPRMKPRMNPEIKAKWVALLKSGEIEQTTTLLRRISTTGKLRMCVNGVLCELYRRETNKGQWSLVESYGHRFVDDKDDSSCHMLTIDVMDWAGFRGDLVVDGRTKTLSSFNDGVAYDSESDKLFKLTFPELAELIDENL